MMTQKILELIHDFYKNVGKEPNYILLSDPFRTQLTRECQERRDQYLLSSIVPVSTFMGLKLIVVQGDGRLEIA